MVIKMTYIIEVCCTGNNGRSTMGKAIGNKDVSERGLEDIIKFISSGTRAGPKWDNVWTYEKAASMIRRAAKSGLVKGLEIDKERYSQDEDYRRAVQSHAKKALQIMRPIETALRTAALYEIGLEFTGERTQTVSRDDVSLVLGVQQKHAEHVKEIYKDHPNPPQISSFNEYAGVSGEIPDGLGNLDVNVYKNIRDHLLETMPKVIDRFQKEHNID